MLDELSRIPKVELDDELDLLSLSKIDSVYPQRGVYFYRSILYFKLIIQTLINIKKDDLINAIEYRKRR